MIETVTLDELMAEVLPQWLIKALEEMIIYFSDGTQDTCDGEAEEKHPEE